MENFTEQFLNKISEEIRTATLYLKNEERREEKAIEVIEKYFLFNQFDIVGEVPASGANGSWKEMKNTIRIQYRCGYSRNNYAPCIEINKDALPVQNF